MFEGKHVCVAGGTSGINLGIARVLASHGAHVAVFGRDPDKARAASEEIAEVPGASVTMGTTVW